MDIGSEFDDDFFEKPKEKEGSGPSDYEAKICLPLWYMENEAVGKESSSVLLALKHQADYYYFSENYAKAAEIYEHCLELVPSTNNTWKREFMENLSRSLLHLGNTEKALEWGLKLYASSYSADQKVVSMNLLATLCHKLGKFNEELEALHYCIEVHKSCPEFWLRLGLCYAGLFKIDLPGCSIPKSSTDSESESCCAFNSKRFMPCQTTDTQENSELHPATSAIPSTSSSTVPSNSCSDSECKTNTSKCEICTLGIQIVSSCFIHTRELIDSGGPNVLGVARDERIKEKIAASLEHMEVDPEFIKEASRLLGTDFLAGLQDVRDSSSDQFASISEKLSSNIDKSKA